MMLHNEAYEEAKAYLGASCSLRARHLRGEASKNASDKLLFSMVDSEEVADKFQGATVWWAAYKNKLSSGSIEAWYMLYYQEQHRDLVLNTYLPHVRREGREIIVRGRDGWATHVQFEHRKTFDKLAMDPVRKQEIIDDLEAFKNGKEYYAHLGKPWKRGYLLHGPPGTGKSTMVAAMANFLDYDVYDLELTSVKSNTELRRLLVATKSKSIIVIEDIDCLLDILRSRDKMKLAEDEHGGTSAEAAAATGVRPEENNKVASGVTLSGVLNFVDGLWSACSEERIIVFTTNHLEELDPALIRRGRMDMHIEMSYCGFEAFKFLAKLYLRDDVESHQLFGAIAELLGEVNMTPADVAENLTRKHKDAADVDVCLAGLVRELEKIKKEANIEGA
jgi:SpoVK/Ycf46/Vps4 family AAA+-type ATPase